MRRAALTLVAAILLAGCLTAPPTSDAPGEVAAGSAPHAAAGGGGGEGGAPAPEYDVGHRWTYASETRNHSHLVHRVIGAEGAAWTLQNGRYVWNESKATLASDRGWGPTLRFPLAPGDAWTATEAGEAFQYAAEAAHVEVPAGAFDAVRVTKTDAAGQVRGVYDYAAAAERVVRLEEYDAAGGLTRDLALTDYTFTAKDGPSADAHGWLRDMTGANVSGERVGRTVLPFEVGEAAQDMRLRFRHDATLPTQSVRFAVVTAEGERWPVALEGGAAVIDVFHEVPAGEWRVEAWAESPQAATGYQAAIVIHY